MRFLLLNSLLLIIPALVLDGAENSTPVIGPAPVTIEGVVVSETGNRPVENIYVYIVKGEEEALTDSKGKFTITTWQPIPVTLTADHIKYKKTTLIVKEPNKKQLIRIEKK